MADFLYKNEYTESSSVKAVDYEVTGQQIIELWTNKLTFWSPKERREYFNGPHTEHCLSVELDAYQPGYIGIPMVVFFIDDKQIPEIAKTVPSKAQLTALLQKYG